MPRTPTRAAAGVSIAQLIEHLAQAVHGDLHPDCTLLLDVPVRVGLERMQARRGAVDRFEVESAQFFDRVRNRYLELARAAPARFRVDRRHAERRQGLRGGARGAREGARPARRCPCDERQSCPRGSPRRAAKSPPHSPPDRLAHGLLIHEDPGAGGLELARWIAQLRQLPRARRARLAANARSAAGSRPTSIRTSRACHPKEESSYILIEAVRDLIADLSLTAHGRGYKVAIFAPADALYLNAAQALLKTLEEPPARTLLLLVTSQPSRLLPTMRSRCSKLRLRGPSREAGGEISRSSARGGAVGRSAGGHRRRSVCAAGCRSGGAGAAAHRHARHAARDRQRQNSAAGAWPNAGRRTASLPVRLACLESWVTDRILETASIRDVTHLSGAGQCHPKICRLFEFSDAIRDMRKLSHTSINKAMAVEALLWRWARHE